MEIVDTFGFNAPAEVVYNSLIDPDRTDRWLPAGVRVIERTDGRVRLAAGSRTVDVEVETAAEDMRLTFRCTTPVQVRGTVRVEDATGGGSRIDVVVTTDDAGPDPATVRDLMAKTMRHLTRDVSDNFTAG